MSSQNLEDILLDFGGQLRMHKIQIELLTGFIALKTGADSYEKYLRSVSESNKFSEETKTFAREWIRQNSLWPSDMKQL